MRCRSSTRSGVSRSSPASWGGLTTFSSFSAEVVAMLMEGRSELAFGTVALHVFGSLVLTWLGIRTAQQFVA
jgi:CrcB protein